MSKPRIKKTAKKTKESVVNIRCTEEQKSMLEGVAAREGMGLSTWLLRLGLVEARNQEAKTIQ
jgi:hypothetical protein